MNAYNLKHLAGDDLLARTSRLNHQDWMTTAELLAHLAEIDDRKLYASEGHPSMFAFCVRGLGMSDDCAAKRIQVFRVTHGYPALYPALADGRLHVSAVRLLAPYLNPMNVDDLILLATRKTCEEIRDALARQFPRSEALTIPEVIPAVRAMPSGLTPRNEHAPWHVPEAARPLSPQRFDLHVTIAAAAHDNLKRARELSGKHVEGVLTRALAHYVRRLEKKKHADTDRPRAMSQRPNGPRTIPASVKREVWERDQGVCGFIALNGRACGSRVHLEYDHLIPLALGGDSTVANIRLLCRTHNQLEAERRLGKGFMESRRARAERDRNVISGLRGLGVGASQARAIVAELEPELTLEEALRESLKRLAPAKPQSPCGGPRLRELDRVPEPVG